MEKIIKNKFGFYSVKDMPTVDELSEYYEKKYFQKSAGLYRGGYNQYNISLENHLNFIKSLELNEDELYFLVKKKDDYVGIVYFTNLIKRESYFGLYSNPNNKIAGKGRILEEVSIDFAFNTLKVEKLKLEVFEDNIQVRNLHKKYKFKETGEKFVNGKKVICMELDCRGEEPMKNTEIKKVILHTVRLTNNMKKKDFKSAFKCLDNEFKKLIGYTIMEYEDKEKIGADKVDIYYEGELVASVTGCNFEDYYKFFDSEEEIFFLI